MGSASGFLPPGRRRRLGGHGPCSFRTRRLAWGRPLLPALAFRAYVSQAIVWPMALVIWAAGYSIAHRHGPAFFWDWPPAPRISALIVPLRISFYWGRAPAASSAAIFAAASPSLSRPGPVVARSLDSALGEAWSQTAWQAGGAHDRRLVDRHSRGVSHPHFLRIHRLRFVDSVLASTKISPMSSPYRRRCSSAFSFACGSRRRLCALVSTTAVVRVSSIWRIARRSCLVATG